jgi:hypothetical protein
VTMQGEQDAQGFDASHLDFDFDFPRLVDETAFPDIYVGLDIDLLAPGDGIVTDRHHASADRYEAAGTWRMGLSRLGISPQLTGTRRLTTPNRLVGELSKQQARRRAIRVSRTRITCSKTCTLVIWMRGITRKAAVSMATTIRAV